MKKLIFLSIMVISAATSFGQTSAVDSVKGVINRMFMAMKTSDSTKLMNTFADSAVLQTVVKSKDGKVSVKSEEIREFASQISPLTKGDADERIVFDVVKVDADLAIAWTPYRFYYKGNFSHCGVNSFQLVRINDVWKIQYIIDTRRKGACI